MKRKNASPNAALIRALKPKPSIPYDPELMAAVAENFQRTWQELETLRLELYGRVLPWFRSEVTAAGAPEDGTGGEFWVPGPAEVDVASGAFAGGLCGTGETTIVLRLLLKLAMSGSFAATTSSALPLFSE